MTGCFKIVRGAVIILLCYFAGEWISGLISNFLSASVVGMILLFLLLCTGIVKKEHVDVVALFLMNNLILFFIPALVGVTLIDFSNIYNSLTDIILVSVLSTFFVMLSTGLFVEWREKKGGRKDA